LIAFKDQGRNPAPLGPASGSPPGERRSVGWVQERRSGVRVMLFQNHAPPSPSSAGLGPTRYIANDYGEDSPFTGTPLTARMMSPCWMSPLSTAG
ncbi:hypothetical protein SKAU_G00178950, partial [Synaphobranchus kaupii]